MSEVFAFVNATQLIANATLWAERDKARQPCLQGMSGRFPSRSTTRSGHSAQASPPYFTIMIVSSGEGSFTKIQPPF